MRKEKRREGFFFKKIILFPIMNKQRRSPFKPGFYWKQCQHYFFTALPKEVGASPLIWKLKKGLWLADRFLQDPLRIPAKVNAPPELGEMARAGKSTLSQKTTDWWI